MGDSSQSKIGPVGCCLCGLSAPCRWLFFMSLTGGAQSQEGARAAAGTPVGRPGCSGVQGSPRSVSPGEAPAAPGGW